MPGPVSTPDHSGLNQSRKEDKFHEFHCHGNLQLRSTDNIIVKVFSDRLIKVSTVFKDMKDIGTIQTPGGHKRKLPSDFDIIDISFDSFTIAAFVDMISVSIPRPMQLDFPSSLALYNFCDTYDIELELKKMVKTGLFQHRTNGCQWELLIWSGDHNDVELAREILKIMNPSAFIFPKILDQNKKPTPLDFWSAVGRLPTNWRYDILRLGLRAPNRPSGYYTEYDKRLMEVSEAWGSIGAAFDPPH